MTEQPIDSLPVSRKRRIANIVGISLLGVTMIGIGYSTVTGIANSQSASDHLLSISSTYYGVEKVEAGAPKVFDIHVTVGGKTMSCADPSKEDIAARKPLNCEHGTVFINAKP